MISLPWFLSACYLFSLLFLLCLAFGLAGCIVSGFSNAMGFPFVQKKQKNKKT